MYVWVCALLCALSVDLCRVSMCAFCVVVCCVRTLYACVCVRAFVYKSIRLKDDEVVQAKNRYGNVVARCRGMLWGYLW